MKLSLYSPDGKLTLPSFDMARFWRFVDKNGPNGCWLWEGFKDSEGYGRFWMGKFFMEITNGGRLKNTKRAPVASYMMLKGSIPKGKFVCHKCDNPPCVNPAHLWLGTAKENTGDMYQKGRAATGDRNGSRLYPERLRRGEAATISKLTEDDVRAIRKLWTYRKITLHDLADIYGVCFTAVHKIVKRHTWKHVV